MRSEMDELRIGYSKWRLAGRALLSAGMSLLCAGMALHWLPHIPRGSNEEFFGYLGMALFGVGAALSLWRLATEKGDVIVLSPFGLTDTRIAAEPIPWAAIRDIGVHTIKRQKFIVISVEPRGEAALTRTGIANWSRAASRWLGVDGQCMTASGLKISHDALLNAVLQRWSATRSRQQP